MRVGLPRLCRDAAEYIMTSYYYLYIHDTAAVCRHMIRCCSPDAVVEQHESRVITHEYEHYVAAMLSHALRSYTAADASLLSPAPFDTLLFILAQCFRFDAAYAILMPPSRHA